MGLSEQVEPEPIDTGREPKAMVKLSDSGESLKRRGFKIAVGLFLKRTLDLAGSIAGLVLLSPLFLLLAVMVKVDSPGPALFSQKRVGRNQKEFTFYKFRSMYANCDERLHHDYMAKLISTGAQESLKGKDGCFKLEEDPRVTRIGRFLRKSSLDELPQLVNVLKGDMSLVGPRPAIGYEVEMYEPWHMGRLAVKPGITGLWQVSGRSEKDFQEMVELDLDYIDNWSVWFDLKIIMKTFVVVFSRQGAW
ncbi:MAG: sugar transferase [Candidatus Aquicultor sp.]